MFRFTCRGNDLSASGRMARVAVRLMALMVSSVAISLMLLTTACGGESGAKTARNGPPGGASMRVAYVLADGRLATYDAASGTRLWQFTTSDPSAMPSMALCNGILYLSDGDLYAMRASDGRLLWQTPVGGGAFVSPLRVLGSMAYVESSGTVYAVRLGGGQLAWRATVGAGLNALLADGASVYVAAGNARGVMALNASDGMVRWRSESEFGADMAYAFQMAAGTLYVSTTFNRLLALNPADGRARWAYQDPRVQALSQPTIAGGHVYVTARRVAASTSGIGGIGAQTVDTAIALRARDGSPLWQRQLTVGQATAPVAPFFGPLVSNDGSTVYAVAGPSAEDVVALSTADGRMRWQEPSSDTLPSLLDEGGRVLYSGGASGTVTAMNGASGSVLWRVSIGQKSAVLRLVASEDTLFVAAADGSCAAIDERTGRAHWQAAGGDASASAATPVSTTILFASLSHAANATKDRENREDARGTDIEVSLRQPRARG